MSELQEYLEYHAGQSYNTENDGEHHFNYCVYCGHVWWVLSNQNKGNALEFHKASDNCSRCEQMQHLHPDVARWVKKLVWFQALKTETDL